MPRQPGGATMQRLRRQRGFTMVELLVVTVSSVVFFGALYTVSSMGQRATSMNMAYMEASQAVRFGMDRMISELRQVKRSTIAIPAENEISFQLANNSDTIQYVLGGVNGTQLLRRVTGTETVICNNVKSVQFGPVPFSGNMVAITLDVAQAALGGQQLLVVARLQGRLRVRN